LAGRLSLSPPAIADGNLLIASERLGKT